MGWGPPTMPKANGRPSFLPGQRSWGCRPRPTRPEWAAARGPGGAYLDERGRGACQPRYRMATA